MKKIFIVLNKTSIKQKFIFTQTLFKLNFKQGTPCISKTRLPTSQTESTIQVRQKSLGFFTPVHNHNEGLPCHVRQMGLLLKGLNLNYGCKAMAHCVLKIVMICPQQQQQVFYSDCMLLVRAQLGTVSTVDCFTLKRISFKLAKLTKNNPKKTKNWPKLARKLAKYD